MPTFLSKEKYGIDFWSGFYYNIFSKYGKKSEATELEEKATLYTYEKEENLIAYWAFDSIESGVIRDVSGGGHDGKVVGEPEICPGYIYNGLRITESGQGVVIENTKGFDFTENDSFTIEICYKWDGKYAGKSWPCIMQRGLDVPKKAFHYLGFWINSGCRRIALGVTGAGGAGTHNITAQINADTDWHKAVAIQDGKAGTLSFFIDGVPQRQEPSVNISAPDMPLTIGFCDAESAFIGSVDEIKIYNCAKPADFTVTGVDVMEYKSFDYKDNESGASVTLPYRLFLPDGYKENDGKKYPLLFFLHGYGECGTDNMQQIRVLGGPNALLDRVVEKGDCIIVAPQCQASPAELNWVPINKQWSIGSRELTEKPTVSLAAATELLKTWLSDEKVDKDRVYAAGISMGGYGTWELITRHPEWFAAAVPVCGSGIPSLAARLKNIAIWAMHGEADTTVPPQGTRDMENAIRAAGGNIRTTFYPGVGHNSWPQAYSEKELIDWLFAQKKSGATK